MGAGASAAESSVPLGNTLASREAQGQELGMEYEVTFLKPKLRDVKLNEKYILRVGYEALVLLKNDETKQPLTYFKYQDIISWGSTSKFFTFKMFGTAIQNPAPVSIVFATSKGKEIEKVTLSSVHALMGDMDRIAVSKNDFSALKCLLMGIKPTPSPAVDPDSPTTKAPTDKDAAAADKPDGVKVKSEESEAIPGSMDANIGSVEAEPAVPLTCEEFITTVEQFALSRSYTVFQAVQLMELAMANNTLDSFDRVNFAVILWKSTLNRDSFQLVINVFDDEGDRENVIARVKDLNVGKLSANLLSATCTGAGGGLDVGTPAP